MHIELLSVVVLFVWESQVPSLRSHLVIELLLFGSARKVPKSATMTVMECWTFSNKICPSIHDAR